MSGHSKWANIKRTKAKVDAQRGKLFSRLAKDIMSAARHGGPNPEANIRLKTAIQKAREGNMPNENIDRVIKRAIGGAEGAAYEEVIYEGYGAGGIAVMLEIVTDNRNRTAADIRHLFNKHGGSLGEAGCVAWMFQKQGIITVEQGVASEDDLILVALEAGAEDVEAAEEGFTVTCAPEQLDQVLAALSAAGVPVDKAGVEMVPQSTVEVSGEEAQTLLKLLDQLEDLDDVQNVYANLEVSEAELEAFTQ